MASVLLIEDEKSTVMLVTRALKNAGHDVTAAEDGEDGVAKFKAMRPDLVIVDMGLPGLSGFEVIRQIRAETSPKKTAVLALTAAITSGDRDEAYEAGCDAYENKPVDLTRLLARITELTTK